MIANKPVYLLASGRVLLRRERGGGSAYKQAKDFDDDVIFLGGLVKLVKILFIALYVSKNAIHIRALLD